MTLANSDVAVPPRARRLPVKLLVLAALFLLGVLAQRLGLVEWPAVLEFSRGYAHHWWFPPLLALLMAGLYALALPGSFVMWLCGALYAPEAATPIILVGGVGGALLGYFFAERLAAREVERIRFSPLFAFIRRHGDFVALSAARLFPSFPHSVINYGSGILRLPLRAFVLSTVIGFAVKGYLYSLAIYQLTAVDEVEDFFSWQLIVPLLLLSLLFLAAKIFFGRKPTAKQMPPP